MMTTMCRILWMPRYTGPLSGLLRPPTCGRSALSRGLMAGVAWETIAPLATTASDPATRSPMHRATRRNNRFIAACFMDAVTFHHAPCSVHTGAPAHRGARRERPARPCSASWRAGPAMATPWRPPGPSECRAAGVVDDDLGRAYERAGAPVERARGPQILPAADARGAGGDRGVGR